jgi:hypothetical protein
MCKMLQKCYPSLVSSKSKFEEFRFNKELLEMYSAMNIKLKPYRSWRGDTFVTSYNTPELIANFDNNDKNSEGRIPTMNTIGEFNRTIMKNFVKSGLISLENSPEFI